MRKLDQARDKLYRLVREQKLFPAGAKLLLCCSGGADSMALVHLFHQMRSRMQLTLLVVHVNHQLRGEESEADAELVKQQCLQLNIPVIVRKIRLTGKGDLENQARRKRFEVFHQILDLYRFDYIVTGHHHNDQAETMLMNLCRGAGLGGLAGIKPVSGKVLHPLLGFRKSELIEILNTEQIPWREDASNQDQSLRRNWIRHTLIPLLERELNPSLGDKLGWQAQIFAEAEELIQQRLKPILKRATVEQTPEAVTLDIPVLLKHSKLEQYYLLKSVIKTLCGSDRDFFQSSFEQIHSILSSAGSKQLRLNNGLYVKKQYQELLIGSAAPNLPAPEPFSVDEDRSLAVYGNYRFSFKMLRVLPRERDDDRHRVYLDADQIRFPFTIRSRRPGDRFVPFGMSQAQKVKDYLINAKVPKFERDQVPVFDDGEKIFWLAGQRLDARVAVREASTRYLRITAELVHAKPMRAASRTRKTGEEDE
ncbi:MAG TPA: tRNA lysidine(34) synthetase TilS [Candidatus Syntrophosphaera sp.]|nr:tRNA lysidine(34) synthetase TilS [Candidatus Syntrophosphaera sp.]